jgi:Streptomyces sporulation and cell division protein, SsgA
MSAHPTVTCELRLRLLVAGDAALPVPAALRYDVADPYAVHAAFHAGDETVEWVFARELLSTGLRDEAGLGDVRVWPSSETGVDVVYVSLSSPEGEALLEAPARELSMFLKRTYAAVPAGSESAYLDIDTALANLLAGS